VTTDENGGYHFTNLPAGTYELKELHPSAFLDGDEVVGQPAMGEAGDDRFVSIDLPAGTHATGYHFAERGLRADFITKQLLLASTPTTDQLAAEFVTRGDQWYRLEAEQDAQMRIDVEAAGEPFTVEIYSSGMLPIGLFAEADNVTIPAAAGEAYVLHIAASVPDSSPPIQVAVQLDEQSAMPESPADPIVDPRDVNHDGVVTPLDVLLVLNAINRSVALSAATMETSPIDVSGDGLVTSVDALIVIDYLNAVFLAAAADQNGEGEEQELITSQALKGSTDTESIHVLKCELWESRERNEILS
jgi:hypothetical protein